MMNQQLPSLQFRIDSGLPFLEGDVDGEFVEAARRSKQVAWDIETSGLDWHSERIGLCQVMTRDTGVCIVKIKKNKRPARLGSILEDDSIQKVFHHAMFDLRFLAYHWNARPANIACTKIASKLINPEKVEGHTLKDLLSKYLGVEVDKSSRKSDWLTWGLSIDQWNYATKDVRYLSSLLDVLLRELKSKNRLDLAYACFRHIPTQVELEIDGFKNIYEY